MAGIMTNPKKDAVNLALNAVKTAVEEMQHLKTSITVLQLLLGRQLCGENRDHLAAFLTIVRELERQLGAEDLANIDAMFEALKCVAWKPSSEHDA